MTAAPQTGTRLTLACAVAEPLTQTRIQTVLPIATTSALMTLSRPALVCVAAVSLIPSTPTVTESSIASMCVMEALIVMRTLMASWAARTRAPLTPTRENRVFAAEVFLTMIRIRMGSLTVKKSASTILTSRIPDSAAVVSLIPTPTVTAPLTATTCVTLIPRRFRLEYAAA